MFANSGPLSQTLHTIFPYNMYIESPVKYDRGIKKTTVCGGFQSALIDRLIIGTLILGKIRIHKIIIMNNIHCIYRQIIRTHDFPESIIALHAHCPVILSIRPCENSGVSGKGGHIYIGELYR